MAPVMAAAHPEAGYAIRPAGLANVGALAYTSVKLLLRRLKVRQVYLEVPAIFLLVIVGVLACVLLIMWKLFFGWRLPIR